MVFKSPRYFLPSFESTGFSVQEKIKIDFLDGDCDGHIGFPIRIILAIVDLQVIHILPTKFQFDWHFFVQEKFKIAFSRRPWQASLISNRNYFSYFRSASHLDTSYQFSSQSASRFLRRRLIYFFQTGGCGGHLGFPIETILALAIFYLQIARILPTKLSANLPFGSGEEALKRYSSGGHGGRLGFSIGTIWAIFNLQVIPILPIKFQVNWPFSSGEEAQNRFSRWRPSYECSFFYLKITQMLHTKFRVNWTRGWGGGGF